MKELLTIVFSVIVSTGIITIVIQQFYDIKIKKHELKLQKYIALSDELAKMAADIPDYKNLMSFLNGALFFSSDEVVKEILCFNKVFTEARKEATSQGKINVQISSDSIIPLMIAIRSELDLKSESIKKEKDLSFFKAPKN